MYVGVGPPPPRARQVGQPQPKPPSRHGDQGGGGGGVGQMGLRAIPPPRKAIGTVPEATDRDKRSGEYTSEPPDMGDPMGAPDGERLCGRSWPAL